MPEPAPRPTPDFRGLQLMFADARLARFPSRSAVAEAASQIPGAGDISEDFVRHLETGMVKPPPNALSFRAVLAVLRLPIFPVLRLMGYWPPLAATSREALALEIIEEGSRIAGWGIEKRDGVIVISRK